MKLIQKAIIKQGDKYLIGQRSPDAKYFPQHWDLFGGTLEPNEDAFSGVKREVKEETDLDIEPIEVVGIYEFDLDNKGEITHRFTLYSAEVISGEIKLNPEHTNYRWATKKEIWELKVEPYFKPFFDEHPEK